MKDDTDKKKIDIIVSFKHRGHFRFVGKLRWVSFDSLEIKHSTGKNQRQVWLISFAQCN